MEEVEKEGRKEGREGRRETKIRHIWEWNKPKCLQKLLINGEITLLFISIKMFYILQWLYIALIINEGKQKWIPIKSNNANSIKFI
jgi:hypothetical protein